jgi:hypothetical protein
MGGMVLLVPAADFSSGPGCPFEPATSVRYELKPVDNANRYLQADGSMIPTGKHDLVAGTRFDYLMGGGWPEAGCLMTWPWSR